MLNKHKYWHALECLLLAIVVAVLSGVVVPSDVTDTKDSFALDKDTLRCVISLSSRLGSNEGKGSGLSYEMLNYFGDYADSKMVIRKAQEGESLLDSLKAGSIDLLVMAYPKDTLGEGCEDFYTSRHIRNNIYWLTSVKERLLMYHINLWLDDFMGSRLYNRSVAKYYRQYGSGKSFKISNGCISPFDDIIKQYASQTGVDWLLLASLIYQESQYYIRAEYREAKGLMQVTETTAARYGVEDLFDPSENIKAGSYYFRHLVNKYKQEGLDSLNVIKFALASYNAGDGRIEQCRDHAMSVGMNPNDWEEVVSTFATNDSFIGATTTAYVRDIMARYDEFKDII